MENTFAVEIQGLSKSFKDFKALDAIDLNIKHGEKVVICGPSGSGKSTLISCRNGLEQFDDRNARGVKCPVANGGYITISRYYQKL